MIERADPSIRVSIPDPCLVVLVGPAGSGKTTLAARLFARDEILSSEDHRALVSGDPADQRVTRVAFSILHRSLERRLAAGRLTVVDATNVERHARQALLVRSTVAGLPAVAIVLDVPLELAVARNRARPVRRVDDVVIARQWSVLADALGRDLLAGEGFAAVWRIGPAGLDGLVVERVSRARQ
jgi:protein phosphatase